jgi:tetratricopeptide (TPR) repeat protein
MLAVVLIFSSTACIRSAEATKAHHLESGKAKLAKKDYDRAILEFLNANLRKATTLDPKHTDAQLKLAELMVASRNQQYIEEAQKRLQEILKITPGHPDVLDVLALTELQLGQPDQAEQHLRQALEKFPGHLKSTITLASMKMSQKDLDSAEAVLKEATRQDPQSVFAVVSLGEFYLYAQRPAEAEGQFQRVLEMEPNNAQALIYLAGLQFRTGRRELAEKTYKRVSALPDKQYKHLHALFLMQAGKTEAGIAEFEKLMKDDPNDRDARDRLVAAYIATTKIRKADQILEEALRKNPRDTGALLQRAKIMLLRNEPAQAETVAMELVRFQPDSAEAHYTLARIHQSRGAIHSQKDELLQALALNKNYLAPRLDLVRVALSTNDAKTAEELLDQAPQEQKTTLPFIVARNWLLFTQDRLDELQKGIEAGLAQTRPAELLLQQAFLKMRYSDYYGARACLEEILQHNPEDLRALDTLVRSHVAQNQAPAALRKVREYAARRPNSSRLQYFLGQSLVASGSSKEARIAFEAAKSAEPGFEAADLALAGLDFDEGRLESARARLSSLPASKMNGPAARLLMAGVERASGNITAAIHQYRKVLELDPAHVMALNNLAYLLTDAANQPDEGLKFAQQAMEIAPDNAHVNDTIGWVYYKKGVYRMAQRYFEGAVAKEATARRKYHLAMSCFQLGDRKRGQQVLDAALQLNPNLPEAKATLELRAAISK